MTKAYHKLIILGLLVLLAIACKSPKPLMQNDFAGMQPIKGNKERIIAAFDSVNAPIAEPCYEGKVRLSMRTAEDSQNGSARFTLCDAGGFYRLKNPLGIEAARIWQKRDSLVIWDLINKEAIIYQQATMASPQLEAFAGIELMKLLHPQISTSKVQMLEDSTYYLINFQDGEGWLVDKQSLKVQQILRPTYHRLADRIQLHSYRKIGDRSYPIRMDVLNSREQTNIFLQLQELNPSYDGSQLQIDLPDGIRTNQ